MVVQRQGLDPPIVRQHVVVYTAKDVCTEDAPAHQQGERSSPNVRHRAWSDNEGFPLDFRREILQDEGVVSILVAGNVSATHAAHKRGALAYCA